MMIPKPKTHKNEWTVEDRIDKGIVQERALRIKYYTIHIKGEEVCVVYPLIHYFDGESEKLFALDEKTKDYMVIDVDLINDSLLLYKGFAREGMEEIIKSKISSTEKDPNSAIITAIGDYDDINEDDYLIDNNSPAPDKEEGDKTDGC